MPEVLNCNKIIHDYVVRLSARGNNLMKKIDVFRPNDMSEKCTPDEVILQIIYVLILILRNMEAEDE